MSGAFGDHVKTIKTIFVVDFFLCKKVFSGERFRIKRSFYTSYKIDDYLSSKLHVEGELFPLKNRYCVVHRLHAILEELISRVSSTIILDLGQNLFGFC